MHIEFDDSLITGNEMIDSQHQEWIVKINNFLNNCDTKAEKSVAVKTLNFLADYTDFHFNAEEQLQEEMQYPGIDNHKKQHQEFKQSVTELHEMLEEQEGPSDAFVVQVNKNIVDWLYTHIRGFDRSVAEYKHMRDNDSRL